MKSQKVGKNISEAEVQNVSLHGIWLYVQEGEYFLSYEDYPWFRNAKVSEIYDLELLHGHHLHWPKLDVDLELESLEKPKNYPLVYK